MTLPDVIRRVEVAYDDMAKLQVELRDLPQDELPLVWNVEKDEVGEDVWEYLRMTLNGLMNLGFTLVLKAKEAGYEEKA